MKIKWVVRVVLFRGIDSDEAFIDHFMESFRYAGFLRLHRDDVSGVCFDLIPPVGVDQKVWASQNAERMQTFDINAVLAPAVWAA